MRRTCVGMPVVGVAMSGGVDSGLVAAAAHAAFGKQCIGMTVHSELTLEYDLERAVHTAGRLKMRHHVVPVVMMDDVQIRANRGDRCYHCKKKVFEVLSRELGEGSLILDGTNADDDPSRPGLKAAGEFGVLSPLKCIGLDKTLVRDTAKAIGLPFWDAPSESCLATRIATGVELSSKALDRVKAMESFYRERGVEALRVYHDNLVATVVYMKKDSDIIDENRDSFAAMIKRIGLESCLFKEWS